MEIDLLLDPFGATWPEMLEAARAAEAAGFGGIWTWDHLAGSIHGESHVLECWTVLTGLAVAVPRVMLGPCVLNVANRSAGTLAVMAATLQHLSGGRLLLGIGAGGGPGTPYELEQRALDREVHGDVRRRRAVQDTIRTLREVWSGSRKGVSGFMTPSPPVPIIVGGFGPKMADLAGRIADGINIPANAASLIPQGKPGFIVTGSAAFGDALLAKDSPQRQRLEQQGFQRIILGVRPPYPVERIKSARIQ